MRETPTDKIITEISSEPTFKLLLSGVHPKLATSGRHPWRRPWLPQTAFKGRVPLVPKAFTTREPTPTNSGLCERVELSTLASRTQTTSSSSNWEKSSQPEEPVVSSGFKESSRSLMTTETEPWRYKNSGKHYVILDSSSVKMNAVLSLIPLTKMTTVF